MEVTAVPLMTPGPAPAGDAGESPAVCHVVDIRPFLRPFNLLEIELSGGSSSAGRTRVDAVWLEILEQ